MSTSNPLRQGLWACPGSAGIADSSSERGRARPRAPSRTGLRQGAAPKSAVLKRVRYIYTPHTRHFSQHPCLSAPTWHRGHARVFKYYETGDEGGAGCEISSRYVSASETPFSKHVLSANLGPRVSDDFFKKEPTAQGSTGRTGGRHAIRPCTRLRSSRR